MAQTKIEWAEKVFRCPNCNYDFWPEIERMLDVRSHKCRCKYENLFNEIMICYICDTNIRIYEENDFGEWTQEVVQYRDPNQTELLIRQCPEGICATR